MRQMYKVFFYQHTLFIGNSPKESAKFDLTFNFTNIEELKQFLFVKIISKEPLSVYIQSEEAEMLWEAFCSLFRVKKAAGGLVFNADNEWLFIKRRGKWDLPKGHIEKHEKKKIAAIREVEEECGLNNLELISKIKTTYHTYWIKGKAILKPTHWYLMRYHGNDKGSPQTEEDITEVRWANTEEVSPLMQNTYGLIFDVFQKGIVKNKKCHD